MVAIVRLVSTYTRAAAVGFEGETCAKMPRWNKNSAEHVAPTARDCCKKRRRSIGAMRQYLRAGSADARVCSKHTTVLCRDPGPPALLHIFLWSLQQSFLCRPCNR